MTPLGRNLKAARGRLGLTQTELSLKATVSIGVVARLETCETANPHAGTIAKLAEALDTTVDVLMGYESASPEANNGSFSGPSVHEHTDQSGADSTVQHSPDQVSSEASSRPCTDQSTEPA